VVLRATRLGFDRRGGWDHGRRRQVPDRERGSCEHLFYTTLMCNGGDETDALTTLLAAVDTFAGSPEATRHTGSELADRRIRLRHGIACQ
jgi:hypothetical protein